MHVSQSWCEEVAKNIIWEFEQLLCEHDIKIHNNDVNENKSENEDDSHINKKDYNLLEKKVAKHIKDFAEYIEYTQLDVA